MTRRYVVGMVLYVATFALTFLSVTLSLALIVGLALLVILPEPGSRKEEPEASPGDKRVTEESDRA